VVALETSTIAPVISAAAPVVETTLVSSPIRLCGLVPYSSSDSDSPDEMVTARPLSSSEFPIASVTAPPRIRRWKRVGPLPACRLALRHASPHSLDHRPSSSSSSSDSSPIGLPSEESTRHSEAFRHWCAALLSTLYPPTTSESSSGDSSERPLHSSSHSVRPSRKRCRSPVDYVPSSTPVIGSLATTRVDLLPPRKRFRDSYSSEASIKEDTEIDPIKTEVDMELGI
ncbi:hypothetical protein Tco_0096422, partial [Tanacetum coccineum]